MDSVGRAISQGNRDVIVLFHDICPTTAANLGTYLKAIQESAAEVERRKLGGDGVVRAGNRNGLLAVPATRRERALSFGFPRRQ